LGFANGTTEINADRRLQHRVCVVSYGIEKVRPVLLGTGLLASFRTSGDSDVGLRGFQDATRCGRRWRQIPTKKRFCDDKLALKKQRGRQNPRYRQRSPSWCRKRNIIHTRASAAQRRFILSSRRSFLLASGRASFKQHKESIQKATSLAKPAIETTAVALVNSVGWV